MYHINKLGGTAVGNYKYYSNIYKIAMMQKNPVFVVSAINPITKNTGTTTQLINIHNNWNTYKKHDWSFMKENFDPFKNIMNSHKELETMLGLDSLCNDNYKPSHEIIQSNVIGWREQLQNKVRLDNFIYLGELLSANILSGYLNKRNLDSEVIDLTDIMKHHRISISNSTERQQLIDHCKYKIPSRIKSSIPIFTGYFGSLNSYEILGRGYSDTTSAIISSVCDSPLTVWKESGGVFTGHPFKITNADQLDSISLNEANELTSFGNDVLHPMTSQFTREFKFNVDIRDIRDLEDAGTKIRLHGGAHDDKLVTAISVKENITIVNVSLDKGKAFFDVINHIRTFNPLLISITKSVISIAIDANADIDHVYDALESCGSVKILENRSCISCIGEGMKKQLGTSSKIFTELAKIGKNIVMICQGPDEINVSVIVDSNNLWQCVQLLHDKLIIK